MENIQLKYHLLDAASRKEVSDFLDFLLYRKKKTTPDISAYKQKILNVSTWSEENLQDFDISRNSEVSGIAT